MKKPGGRPPMTEGKRIRKIDARFTEAEYRLIEEMEQTLGLKKTELVRLRLLEGSLGLVVNAKELMIALDKVGTELGRAGNNINQLARYANLLNQKGALSPAVAQEFVDKLGRYHRHQETLDRLLRRILKH
jgi:hypothetical protein